MLGCRFNAMYMYVKFLSIIKEKQSWVLQGSADLYELHSAFSQFTTQSNRRNATSKI